MGAENKTLIGDDATIEEVTLGTEKLGDATKTLDELAGGAVGSGKGKGGWIITAKAAAASIFGDLAVGDYFPADGDEVLVVGDKAKQVTATELLDASGWSANFNAQEVETTLLRHKVKKYRKGKADADGTLEGVFTLGVTGEASGLVNQFLKVVQKNAAGAITVSAVNSHPIYIRGVIRNTNVSGETYAYIFAQIELFGVSLGAKSGSNQAYSSKFRFTGADPVYYEEDIA
ncbi:MAG TPA: hypothetical protein PLB91_01225 [Spirochaetales bacterium]|nr:hypothetical protein [Spirochaetales bacterium]HRY54300.1 hypothetical protein [Spirochaetia bacterium]